MSTLSNKDRWVRWMLLEHGPGIQSKLEEIWSSYHQPDLKFDKMYIGCGHDAGASKYVDWDMLDIRQIEAAHCWDVLMGIPREDDMLDIVKSKLSIGMFTLTQTRFVFHEVARVLKVGGKFDLTFRDFDRLLGRREELDPALFVRYIYGSGMYYGSRRRSCWTQDTVEDIARTYNLVTESSTARGMNTNVILVRIDGKLKRFSPEPKVRFDENGMMINDGGDFPSESR